jgi:hypothetical protein
MKKIYLIIFLINNFTSFGQVNKDSTTFEYLCEHKYKVDFKVSGDYIKYNHHRAFIPTYTVWSCMPFYFSEALASKINKEKYIIYFEFDINAGVSDEYMKKEFPNYNKNKNYLGSQRCQTERDQGLVKVFTNSDFNKFNADTILCIRPDSNSIRKNDPDFNNFLYIVMHKENVGDIKVGFAYKKEYETEVMDEIKNLHKIIKFK